MTDLVCPVKALEAERQRHEMELKEHASLMERDMAALKASRVAEKQVRNHKTLFFSNLILSCLT